MCRTPEWWTRFLDLLEQRKTLILTFIGFGGCAYVYHDFSSYLQQSLVTQAQTVEILRNMDSRISNLEHKSSK